AGIVLAGFSFGAWVGLRVGCEDERVRALVGVGIPADNSDLSYLADCPKPKLFVQGTQDEFGSPTAVRLVVERVAPPKELDLVEGADHFFNGKLEELRRALRDHFPAR
ncbi:MAG: alpha/beta hydrolase, partial [Terriglobia bacterium]